VVSPSCYKTDFEISCDKAFQTNLLYKRSDSPVIFVSGKTTSGSPSGTNIEKVESECFTKDGECDYLTTLWATFALVLGSNDAYDVSPFWPYLQAMNGENEKIISEGFLGYLSGSEIFKSNLMQRQTVNGYWSASGDNFYDTGFALLPYSGDSLDGKEKTISWLLTPGVQDSDGCWKGNILNTALLLYSVWPREISQVSSSSNKPSCESAGNFCLTPIECTQNAGGTILSDYSCNIASKSCCSKNIILKTCSELGGNICNSNEDCVGGTSSSASNVLSGEKCCVGGSCKEKEQESECDQSQGICVSQVYGCSQNEEETDYQCADSEKICCIEKENKGNSDDKGSGLWIWITILIFLIAIIALLIIFRDKLRPYWLKITNRSGGSGRLNQPNFRGPGMPQNPSSSIPQRGLPIRRIPSQATPGMSTNRVQGFPRPQMDPNQRPGFNPQRNPNFPPRNNQSNEAIDKLKEMNK